MDVDPVAASDDGNRTIEDSGRIQSEDVEFVGVDFVQPAALDRQYAYGDQVGAVDPFETSRDHCSDSEQSSDLGCPVSS